MCVSFKVEIKYVTMLLLHCVTVFHQTYIQNLNVCLFAKRIYDDSGSTCPFFEIGCFVMPGIGYGFLMACGKARGHDCRFPTQRGGQTMMNEGFSKGYQKFIKPNLDH